MVSPFSRRFLSLLSGCCLLVLLSACGSSGIPDTTTGSGTSPTVPVKATTLPTTTPTKLVTPTSKLTVTITCGGTKQDGYGLDVAHGKVCAQTLPGANLSIQVVYCNGKPDPSGVLQGSVTADANGFHQWNWTPQPDCKGQSIWGWTVTVTAQLNGQTATASSQATA